MRANLVPEFTRIANTLAGRCTRHCTWDQGNPGFIPIISKIREIECPDFVKTAGEHENVIFQFARVAVAGVFRQVIAQALDQVFSRKAFFSTKGSGFKECAHESHALQAESPGRTRSF